MRGVVCSLLVVCLASGVARAQEGEGAADAAPDAAVQPPAPAASTGGLASQPERFSRGFAGPGGPLLVLDEAVLGLAAGVVVARAANANPDQTFLSVVGGATALAGLGFLYNYYVPVGFNTAVLTTMASVTGFLLGAGINAYGNVPEGLGQGLVVVGAGQVAIATVLLSTLGQADIRGGDLGLVTAGATWGLVLSLMGVGAFTPVGQTADFRPVLFMPAVGMALGGVAAALTDVRGDRIPGLAILPLAVGLGFHGLGALMRAPQSGAAVGLAATAGTLGLMLLLGPSPQEEEGGVAPAEPRAPRLVAVPVALPAGARGEEVALGGGLALAF